MTWILTSCLVGLMIYGGMGLLFGLWFVLFRLQRLDPGAKQAGWAFRLLILPVVSALWVIFAKRLWCGQGIPTEKSSRRIFGVKKAPPSNLIPLRRNFRCVVA